MEVDGVIKDLFKSVQEDAESLTPSLFSHSCQRGRRYQDEGEDWQTLLLGKG